jgi:hypothetical protein
MVGAALVLALAACGGGKTTPSTTTTTSAARTGARTTPKLPTTLPPTASSVPTSCSAWGKSFAGTFNKSAKRLQNPERMQSVCCAAKNAAGVSHCLLTLTLVGTTSRGCEVVDLNNTGTPVTVGRRIKCTVKA